MGAMVSSGRSIRMFLPATTAAMLFVRDVSCLFMMGSAEAMSRIFSKCLKNIRSASGVEDLLGKSKGIFALFVPVVVNFVMSVVKIGRINISMVMMNLDS